MEEGNGKTEMNNVGYKGTREEYPQEDYSFHVFEGRNRLYTWNLDQGKGGYGV